MENAKELFTKIYKENIRRSGSDALFSWLEQSDFFEAPASTRFHLSCPGGLVTHSVHVYQRLKSLCGNYATVDYSDETIAIAALLHDICKVDFYAVEMRNRKNEQGVWEKYPFYVVNDKLPYGHGEKSVYIASSYMKLTRDEAMAIRWHMGPWQEGEANDAGRAFEKYPLALLTHLADMMATNLDEADTAGGNANG